MKKALVVFLLLISFNCLAEIKWSDYNDDLFNSSLNSGKKILLAFHKTGCGGCKAQEMALEKSQIGDNSNVVFLKVQRTNESHTPIYEKYGFKNKNTWAALVLVNKNGEIARVKPGNFKEEDVLMFAKNANL